MIVNIPLNKIQPNPWQTRLAEPDPEYIKELALDIAANGLLQVPVGRLLSPDGSQDATRLPANQAAIGDRLEFGNCTVQLAFGHNRLAAYRWLYDLRNNSDIPGDYSTIPVDIRYLTDEQMATLAWSENEKRKDVTPIERAKAIERRMADFGWNQTQIAEHLGLNRSTVSNILRLLKLPLKIQVALADGTISERVASALLPMYELPEHILHMAKGDWYLDPLCIETDALNGESSDEIRQKTENLYKSYTRQLQHAEFGLDELFPEIRVHGYGVEGDTDQTVYCGLCRTCDRRLKDAGNICLDLSCYRAKTALHRRMYLANAATASGIEVSDADKGGQVTSLPYNDERARQILATKCPNLRLIYSTDQHKYPDNPRAVEGFPHALIICDKRNNSCSCERGLELAARQPKSQAEIEDEEREDDPTYEGVLAYDPNGDDDDAPDEPVRAQTLAAPTADDLAELARQARLAKKDVAKAVMELKERLSDMVVEWLRHDEPGAFFALVFTYTLYPSKNELDIEKLYRKAAVDIAARIAGNGSEDSVDQLYEHVNRTLARLELPEIDPTRLTEVFTEKSL